MTTNSIPLPIRFARDYGPLSFRYPSLEDILQDVCSIFNESIEMVKSQSKKRDYVICRRIYCYVAGALTDMNCHRIAGFINRDHTMYSMHVSDCIKWFECGEINFMAEWNHYITNSRLWNKNYQTLQRYLHHES